MREVYRATSSSFMQWLHAACADAEPFPELEFDQTLGLKIRAAEMAHAAERGWVWFRRWQGAVSVVD